MKTGWLLASLLLVGCSATSVPPTAGKTTSPWYQAGLRDARAGKAVRDNETLAEWYGNPQIDREAYLSGYTSGQAELCRPATVYAWGQQRRNFPAACDAVPESEPLRQQWLAGIGQANPQTVPAAK